MKNTIIKTLLLMFLATTAYASGNLKNSDFATPAKILGAGGTLDQLLNDDKIWSIVLTEQYSTALANGDIANKTAPFVMGQQATPPPPAAGFDLCYVKADDKFYCEDSAGVETLVGPGGSPSGAPNTFAGYDGAGNLNPIPTWLVNRAYNDFGIATYQNIDAPVDAGDVNFNVQGFEAEIRPVQNTAQFHPVGMRYDLHFDRTGQGFNINDVTGLAMSTTNEGTGTVQQFNNISSAMSLGVGSPGHTVNSSYLSGGTNVGAGYTLDAFGGLTHLLNIDPTATVTSVKSVSTGMGGNISGGYVGHGDIVNGNIGGGYTGSSSFINGNVTGQLRGIEVITNGDSGSFVGAFISQGGAGTAGPSTGVQVNLSDAASNNRIGYSAQMGGGTPQDGSIFAGDFSNGAYTGSINGLNLNFNTASALNATMLNSNLGSGTFSSATGMDLNFGSADITGNENGSIIDLSSGVNKTNSTGQRISINGTQVNATGMQIGGTGTVTAGLTGLNINLSGITSPVKKVGLSIDDGVTFQNFATTTTSAAGFDFGNGEFMGLQVLSGAPITGTTYFSNLHNDTLQFRDDFAAGPVGLSYGATSYLVNLDGDAGHTVDSATGAAFAALIPASSTGGTVTNYSHLDMVGIVNQGGTMTVTNQKGLNIQAGFSAGATNSWGAFIEDTGSDNFFAKDVIVGGATGLPTNASVGIEIQGTTKALLQSRLTTAQRLALTAVNGMQVYDTDLDVFECYEGGAWSDCAAGAGFVTAVTASSPLFSSGGGTPNITLAANTAPGTYNLVTVDAFGLVQAGGNTIDQGITELVGDILAGPGNGVQAATLPVVNPDVGTFNNVTVNAKGQVVGAFASADSGITQLTGDGTAGPGSGSQVLTFASVNPDVGTFNNVTVNAKGLVVGAFNSGSGGTVTDVTATGPIFSSGGSTPNISLGASGVVAGTYTQSTVTVDSFGRITGAASGVDFEFDDGASGGGTVNIDWANDGPAQTLLLDGNPLINFTNQNPGGVYVLRLVQDASGSRMPTWGSNILAAGGTAFNPTLTATANHTDLAVCYSSPGIGSGNKFLCGTVLDFAE